MVQPHFWMTLQTWLCHIWTWKSWMILCLEEKFCHCKFDVVLQGCCVREFHSPRSGMPRTLGMARLGMAMAHLCWLLAPPVLFGAPSHAEPTCRHLGQAQQEGSALMILWECHIWQITTGPFCQWRTVELFLWL